MTEQAGQKVRPVALYYLAQLMFVQMGVVLLATLFMFLLPHPWGLLALSGTYFILVITELRLSVRNPISISVLLLSIIMLFMQVVIFPDMQLGFWTATIFFGALFSISVFFLLSGRPISTIYSKGKGAAGLHWKTSILWTATYGAGLVLSLIIPRRPELFPILPAFLVLAVIATVWLQLFSVGSQMKNNQLDTQGEKFQIVELPPNADALRPFYGHFLREIQHAIRQGELARNMRVEEMIKAEMMRDRSAWPDSTYYAAYCGSELVGTIACRSVSSRADPWLQPLDNPINVEGLLRYGPVQFVRYFSIASSHRFNRELMRLLLLVTIQYAFRKDQIFIVSVAYPNAVGIYEKLGFQRLAEQKVRVSATGVQLYPVILNLARLVVCGLDDLKNSALANDRPMYQDPWAERYFKRLAVTDLLTQKRVWALSDKEIAEICQPTPLELAMESDAHAA